MPDKIELLRRYAEEDSEEAFVELVQQYIGFVHAVAKRQLAGDDAHLADDVTQRVFVDLARKAGTLTQRPTISGWLYRSTIFAAATAVRTERRRRAREEEAQIMYVLQSDLRSGDDGQTASPVLDHAMNALSEHDRDAVMLRFYDELSFAEIGNRLRLTESGARMKVERAIEKLRASLAKRGVTSTTTALSAIITSQAGLAAPAGLAATVSGAALASVTSGGLSTLSFLRFFGTAKAAAGIAGVIGVIAVGAGFHQLQLAREAQATAESENEIQSEHLRSLDRSLATAEQDRDKLLKTVKGLRQHGAADVKLTGNASRNPRSDARKFLALFPEAREAVKEGNKVQTARLFAQFYKSADLTSKQIEQFEGVLGKNQLENLTITPPATVICTLDQPPEDQLRDILGDQGYRQFQDYLRTEYAHRLALGVATEINYAATPLSPGQADQLAQIVADNSVVDPSRNRIDPNSIQWDAVLVQARSILPASQWKIAEGVLLWGQFNQTLAEAQKTVLHVLLWVRGGNASWGGWRKPPMNSFNSC